MLASKKFIDIS